MPLIDKLSNMKIVQVCTYEIKLRMYYMKKHNLFENCQKKKKANKHIQNIKIVNHI